jgi:hypothetical protein
MKKQQTVTLWKGLLQKIGFSTAALFVIFGIAGHAFAQIEVDLLSGNGSSQSTNDDNLSFTQSSRATVYSSSGITNAGGCCNVPSTIQNLGMIINSNPDNSSGELFQIYDSGTEVFRADGGTSTAVKSGTSSVTLNNNGTVAIGTTGGVSVTGGGLNMNSNGISSAGAITGVTTLNTSSNASVGGTLGVTGATTLSGGLTETGTANINTTGFSSTSIGNANSSTSITGNTNINTGGFSSTTIGNTNDVTVTVRGGASGVTVDNTSARLTNGSNSVYNGRGE